MKIRAMSAGVKSLVLPLAVVPLAGCDETSGRPGVVERDSAGVTIVENPALDDAPAFAHVDSVPFVDLGSLDGPPERQLYAVIDAHRYPDGRLSVVNMGTHEIRFFGPTGEYLGATGGEGEGPGEFRAIQGLWARPGDSLWVFDSRNRSFTVLDGEGAFVRAFSFAPEGIVRFPVGVLADGAVVIQNSQVFGSGRQRDGLNRAPVTVDVYRPAGGHEITLGEWPGNEMFSSDMGGRGVAVRGLVFGRQQHAAISRGRVVVGVSDDRSFDIVDRSGALERIVRVAGPLEAVGEGVFDRYVDETLATSANEDFRRMWREMFDAMPRRDTYPAFSEIRGDETGRIWVADYRPPGRDARMWSVFGPDGHLLGRVRTPDGLRIVQIGEDFVLGVWRDELDVEHVRAYRFEAPVTGDATPD